MGHIQLQIARVVLRVMEGIGVMENANGQIINAKPAKIMIMNMIVLIVVIMTQNVGKDVWENNQVPR